MPPTHRDVGVEICQGLLTSGPEKGEQQIASTIHEHSRTPGRTRTSLEQIEERCRLPPTHRVVGVEICHSFLTSGPEKGVQQIANTIQEPPQTPGRICTSREQSKERCRTNQLINCLDLDVDSGGPRGSTGGIPIDHTDVETSHLDPQHLAAFSEWCERDGRRGVQDVLMIRERAQSSHGEPQTSREGIRTTRQGTQRTRHLTSSESAILEVLAEVAEEEEEEEEEVAVSIQPTPSKSRSTEPAKLQKAIRAHMDHLSKAGLDVSSAHHTVRQGGQRLYFSLGSADLDRPVPDSNMHGRTFREVFIHRTDRLLARHGHDMSLADISKAVNHPANARRRVCIKFDCRRVMMGRSVQYTISAHSNESFTKIRKRKGTGHLSSYLDLMRPVAEERRHGSVSDASVSPAPFPARSEEHPRECVSVLPFSPAPQERSPSHPWLPACYAIIS